MSEQEVAAILGHAIRLRPWGEHAVIHDYVLPGWRFSSASLWIYFENGAVANVHAKRHRIFGEDYAVYETRSDRPIFEHEEFESLFSRVR